MGQYTNKDGKVKDCFQLRLQRKVEKLSFESSTNTVNGLQFFGNPTVKHNKYPYDQSDFVICPGESVGTLKSFGLAEPEYARFAGVSLRLIIDIPQDKIEEYRSFNHCMEVHQEGVVLAWQARFINNQIFIGVAGTKAFYADQQPHKNQDFALNRNLLQLNMINDVLPEFISLAFKRPTQGTKLTFDDMIMLENQNIAKRWVGTRAVAFDGFLTLGAVHNAQGQVPNTRCTTHFGSGGVSFGPAGVAASRSSLFKGNKAQQKYNFDEVLAYADSLRTKS